MALVPPLVGEAAVREMHRRSRRAFATGAVGALAAYVGWRWLGQAAMEDRLPWPLRRALRLNEGVVEMLGGPRGLAPTFSEADVVQPIRTNGYVGLDTALDLNQWKIRVEHEGRNDVISFVLSDLEDLERREQISEFKCVEGWSQITHFGGVRFFDFIKRFSLGTSSGAPPDPYNQPKDMYRYVYMATPDERYYVGLDMASAIHPQTMLCDTMNWKPLEPDNGAPLR